LPPFIVAFLLLLFLFDSVFYSLVVNNLIDCTVLLLFLLPFLSLQLIHPGFSFLVSACMKLGFSLLAGMSPYLYLPISAHFKGVDSWGDQSTVGPFCLCILHFFCSIGFVFFFSDLRLLDPFSSQRIRVCFIFSFIS
jgi:hypothetical protein